MLVSQIRMCEIIKRKIQYIETSNIYNDSEFKDVKKGELEAYRRITYDSENMSEMEFINKYFKIVESLNERFERLNIIEDKVEIEQLTGYNNAIIFILSLLNPKYEFENE